MISRLFLSIACSVLLVPQFTPAQETVSQTAPVRDPRATAVADAVLKALAPQTVLADISLQGTVSYTAGSDYQSGTFTFEALGNNRSRALFSLDGGTRQETRSGPYGRNVDPSGAEIRMAVHNCFSLEPWFYPGLTLQSLANDPEISILYVGQESRDGVTLHRLRLLRTISGQPPEVIAQIQKLSAVDLYVDATSYLPLILKFQTHPDDDFNLDIPVEVQFADYKLVNGIRVPFRIQRYLQGNLLFDIAVGGATVNSGLSDNLFSVQAD